MKRTAKTRTAVVPVPDRASKAAKKTDSAAESAERYLLPTYKRAPFVLTHGRGVYAYDSTGKKYLDFLGGIAVSGLGHAHPRIVKTIRAQAGKALHFSNLYHNPFQGPLAKKLTEWSGLDRVFFSNSGAEAIEGALKLARLCGLPSEEAAKTGKKPKIKFLALENSFHGRTFGALSVTATEKYRKPFEPLVPGAEFVKFNDVRDLEKKFDDSVCAVILETIQGEGGIFPVGEEFWNRARELTQHHGALLIADEIQCGLGRTGRYFAYQRFSSKPDIAVVAKPLAAGLPLGAIMTTEAVASRITPGLHGTTFGGGPLTCATALEVLKVIDSQKILANVRARGAELRAGLEALKSKFHFIKEIRGEGLIVGVELSVEGMPFVVEATKRGLLMNCTHDYTLRLLPPFIVTKKQIAEFLKVFERVLSETPKSAAVPKESAHVGAKQVAAQSAAR